jgi:hypothetical protein
MLGWKKPIKQKHNLAWGRIMWGMKRTCVRLAAPLLVSALVGCSVVDDFSGRAVDFNTQAEQVQEQTMLLNVVRASLRRPMQFTGLQSITGSASLSGNGSLSLPFGPPGHRPQKSLSPDVAGIGGSISGGPSFIVPVLDTQEFYEGILNPISLQVFDYYLEQGFPPEVLFDLFVSKVVVTWVKDGTRPGTDASCARGTSSTTNGGLGVSDNSADCIDITYLNSVANDSDFDQFQAIVDLLFAEGLSTEHVENVARYGAPFAVKNASSGSDSARQTAALIQAYAAAAQAGLKVTKSGQDYQLERNTTSYRFCFRDFGAVARNSALLCGRSKKGDEPGARDAVQTTQGEVNAGGSTGFNLSLSEEAQQTLIHRLQQATARISPKAVPLLSNMHVTSFQLQLRSTEGIVYYLGELTRRHLYPEKGKFPDENAPRIIKVPTQVPDGAMPRIACEGDSGGRSQHNELIYPNEKNGPSSAERGPASSYFCDDIFVVDAGGDNNAFITVSYDGNSYGLAQGPDRSGRTYQVLELAKQILAVNTSAKQLPATSVVVISQP